jgi:hypothetical protein
VDELTRNLNFNLLKVIELLKSREHLRSTLQFLKIRNEQNILSEFTFKFN